MKNLKHLEATTIKKKGRLVAIGSTEAEDRSGDSLKMKDWFLDDYLANPVLQAGHEHAPQYTIGIAKNLKIKDKKLTFEPCFHEETQLARDIKAMYEKGVLKAWSVGFLPYALLRSKGDENIEIPEDKTQNELLEISAVAVPANQECLTMAKGYGNDEKKKISNWIKKQVDKKEDKENVKKSPACRQKGETKSKCVSRKIPEIMKEDPNMKQDQAVAIANSLCSKSCEEKEVKIIKRWNRQLPEIFNSKEFDISNEVSKVTTFEYKLYTGYLDCEVRHLNLNNFLIPSPLLGSYLAGFKEILGNYKVIDERNFNYYGTEEPINYEVIKLNSKEEDDFLVQGTRFYKSNKSGKKFIVKFEPCFYGLQAQIITIKEDREWNKDLLMKVKKWVKKNNKLRGEAFCLSGEFIDRGKVEWKDIILPKVIKGAVMKGVSQLEKKGKDSVSRGMMFIGNPGTGKTLTGKAMMNNLKDKTFIWVSARDMEKMKYMRKDALSLAFDLVRQLNPVVLFLEDIDGWLKNATAIDLLKTELDGIQENKGLITVLTSNNPEEFPDSLLDRPGRFHDVLEFSLPNRELREQMIKEWSNVKDFDKDEMKKLIHYTKGFSGAHMKELVSFAKMISENDKVDLKKALFESLDKLIEQKKLIEKIKQNKKKEEIKKEGKGIKLKEGRVLSKKNTDLIKKCVSTTKDTTVALEKLISNSETPIKEDDIANTPEKVKGNGVKGREPKMVKAQNAVELRILQKIAGLSNRGIQKLRNNDK